MNDNCLLVLKRINEGKTFKEIMNEDHLNNLELLSSIKKLLKTGYNFKKYYFYDGNIFFVPSKKDLYLVNNTLDMVYPSQEKELRFVFTSDYHVGNIDDRLDLVNEVYRYCFQNNINNVINTGDMIENIYVFRDRRIDSVNKQIEEVIKNHPKDRRINNFVLYGNHDYYSFTTDKINVGKEIENERYDIVFLGYGRSFFKIGKDYISLEHNIPNNTRPYLKDFSNIVFKGHSHRYKLNIDTKKTVFVPSLSDSFPTNYGIKPLKGFLDVTFFLNNNGLIKEMKIKQISITSSIDLVSEADVVINRKRK